MQTKYLFFLLFFSSLFSVGSAQTITTDTIRANRYKQLAENYNEEWQLDSANYYFRKVAGIYMQYTENEKLENIKEHYVEVLNELAANYLYMSKYEAAFNVLDTAETFVLTHFGSNHAYTADIYQTYGDAYHDISQYTTSLEYHYKALAIHKANNQMEAVARSYVYIGAVYWVKSEIEIALEYLNSALNIYLRPEYKESNIYDIAQVYGNMGTIYFSQEKYDDALTYFQKALELFRQNDGEYNISVAHTYNNMGVVHETTGNYDKAIEYYNKGLDIYKQISGEKSEYVAVILNNIGNIFVWQGNISEAQEHLHKSLNIRKEIFGQKHINIALNYIDLAKASQKNNQQHKALQYYQNAIAASLFDFNDTLDVTKVPVIKNFIESKQVLSCLAAKAAIFTDLSIELPGNMTDSVRYHIAVQHYMAGDTLIDITRRNTTTKADKLALNQQANQIYTQAVETCLQLGEDELAFYFSERNKASVLLEALAGAEAQQFAGIPDSLLQIEDSLQTQIIDYKQELRTISDSLTKSAIENKLFETNRRYDQLIRLFESRFPKYHELKYNKKTANVEQLSELLDNQTAIISYTLTDSCITLFTITKNNFTAEKREKPQNFRNKIELFRYSLINNNSARFESTYRQLGLELYNLLFPTGLSDSIQHLIIIPDAELSLIPFEALLTTTPTSFSWHELPYLIKDYTISYSYSGTLFYQTYPKENHSPIEITNLHKWIGFAPVFSDETTAGVALRTRTMYQNIEENTPDRLCTRGSLLNGAYIAELPKTKEEVETIFEYYETNNLTAEMRTHQKANEAFIKSGALQNYECLHFATHGFTNTWKPELSGIILAQDSTNGENDILHTAEIYNLQLNARLVVLSACETGLGKIVEGEGIIGLTRALLYAGSQNIMVSLWKVADNSTSQLMIDFYYFMLNSEQQHYYSWYLQKAKLKMIENEIFAHPFYWSPFILIGK